MTDSDLIDTIADKIEAYMATTTTPVTVLASNQPTQQGMTNGNYVFIGKVGYKPIGLQKETKTWNVNKFDVSTSQKYESTFQIDALIKRKKTDLITTSDIVNTICMVMNSRKFIRELKTSNITMLRITDVRNPYFKDDTDQHQATPSFDFTISYERSIISAVSKISTIQNKIKGV